MRGVAANFGHRQGVRAVPKAFGTISKRERNAADHQKARTPSGDGYFGPTSALAWQSKPTEGILRPWLVNDN
jgi:hypothetical protein